jgi:hypothetical protein
VPELGGAIDEQDLLELGEHQCYVRLSAGGERLPTFSVALDPPPVTDVAVRHELARASAQRYGRAVEVVEAERQHALERIAALRTAPAPEVVAEAEPKLESQRRARNEHRGRRRRKQKQVEEIPVYA